MPLSNNPFSQNTEQYERWYDEYPAVYQSELNAIRHFWPPSGDELEVGVGAAHFAAPLGITYGVEPSAPMRSAALKRGVAATDAVAEALPFPDNRFDAVLMVNTLCFVADRLKSVHEMFRVLRDGGCAVLAFVDRNSFLGEEYERKRSRSMFYRDAHFVSVPEAVEILLKCGFEGLDTCQTVFVHPDEMTTPDSVEPGYGRGAFVVIIGCKPSK